MWLELSIAVALSGPATATTPPDVETAEPAPRPIAAIVFDASAVDVELAAELALRTAGRELLASNLIGELPAQRFVWLSVVWQGDAHARLELVGIDGRAYDREVAAPPDQLRRALAGAAANMIAAIERGEIAPDRSGVALPRPQPRVPIAPPVRAPPARPARAAPPSSEPVASPHWEIGPNASGVLAIGLGAPHGLDPLVGAGATIGFDARPRSRALLGFSARVMTLSRADLRIVRVRIAASGGYALRRGRFELLGRLGLAVEPIVLRDHGERAQPRRPDGAHASVVPLIGVLAGLSPGVLLRPHPGGPRLRLSLDLELGASMEARAKPGAVRYVDDSGDAPVGVLRAGGLELALGLGVGGWFGLP